MSKPYNGGLNFTWPTLGDTGWDGVVDVSLLQISSHDHTGSGMGTQISTNGIANNSITGAKILLANNEALRSLNASAVATNLLKLNASNQLELLQTTNLSTGVLLLSSSETLVANGAIGLTASLTILNGASLVMTLAAGAEGQIKVVENIAATTATVTPSSTVGSNVISLLTTGSVMFQYASGEWRVMGGQGYVVTDDIQATVAASGTYTITGRIFTFNNAGATTATFSNGVAGQRVTVYNIGAGTVTLTLTGRPAATDVATIVQGGFCELVFINSLWQPFVGVGTTLA